MYKEDHLDLLLLMNKNTPCYIVDFDEMTRQALIEGLGAEMFSTITIKEKKNTKTVQAWKTEIGFARQIRQNGRDAGKQMSFKVVVERSSGTLRYARATEWILACNHKASLARTVDNQIKKKRLTRARIGYIS